MTAVLASYTFNGGPAYTQCVRILQFNFHPCARSVRKCKEYRKNIRRNKNLIESCYIYTLSVPPTTKPMFISPRLDAFSLMVWQWMSSSHEIMFGSTCVLCGLLSFCKVFFFTITQFSYPKIRLLGANFIGVLLCSVIRLIYTCKQSVYIEL